MKSAQRFNVVFVTAPDLKIARKLAKAVLEARAVACVNLVSKIESHYWWQGKVESASEVLLMMKTTRGRLCDLEKLILKNHPYDTPEFITLNLTAGNERYLAWVAQSVLTSGSSPRPLHRLQGRR